MNKKKELEIVPTPCFLWTSLGLNQGPPDYELQKNPHSVRLCDAL